MYNRFKNKGLRPDHFGAMRQAYEKNKKIIIAKESVCGICGRPVDKALTYPNPWSATVDHIIPINKGGHPSDIDNLQLAHFRCNRLKSDRIPEQTAEQNGGKVDNRNLPLSLDWRRYRETNAEQLQAQAARKAAEGLPLMAKDLL